MAKFRFKLEPVLKARCHTEQQRQREVAALEQERQRIEDRIRSQQQFLADSKHQMRDHLVGQLATDDLRLHAASGMRIMQEADRMVVELAGLHQRLSRARQSLIEATRDRRAIELLREKRFQEWKARHEKAEAAALDELVVQRAARSDQTWENHE
ncbi:MAG: hypothetical protein EA377_05210 [Phycisphaerales bacterium]|nr:MAG: hypothetical protein EA377_05210 [Phycisphaerales bacterium]